MERSQFIIGAEDILGYFYDLSQIPRQSGNSEPICSFLLDFAERLGLSAYRDGAENVIIRKKASLGYENAMPIILQSHTDMVCEQGLNAGHDFNGPLALRRDNDKIYAEGTTLGADNGIGMAAAMAMLAGEHPHPQLEAVFTANEETTMSGAWCLDFNRLSGNILISLDSSAVLTSGSGELEAEMRFPKEQQKVSCDSIHLGIQVFGLRGGHTGSQAMDEPGNAILLLVRLLVQLKKKVQYQLVSIHGGAGSSSAFARQAGCTIAYSPQYNDAVTEIVRSNYADFLQEFDKREPDLMVKTVPCEKNCYTFSQKTTDTLINLLSLMPEGLCSMNHEHKGTMESCANCGVLEANDDEIRIVTLIRSVRASKKRQIFDKVLVLCQILGVKCKVCHDIPQWDECLSEDLGALVRRVYKDIPFRIAQGTLECGIFQSKRPSLSIIGLGLPYYYQHSPSEHMFVSEVNKYWKRFKQFMAELKSCQWP